MLSRRQFAVIAATFTAAVVSGAQSLDQGFPPLAGVNIAIGNQTEIDQVLGALREFGKLERLTISEDKILKQARDVAQIKLERDQQTFFYMDNFHDAKSFQLIAYSHVSKGVWQPIWNRLIEKVSPPPSNTKERKHGSVGHRQQPANFGPLTARTRFLKAAV